jgi:hypothetical protein
MCLLHLLLCGFVRGEGHVFIFSISFIVLDINWIFLQELETLGFKDQQLH